MPGALRQRDPSGLYSGATLRPRRPGAPVVLVHHAVAAVPPESDPNLLAVDPLHLEAQVRLLRRLGHRFLTAEELLEATGGGSPPRRTAVLTFDDGWLDALTVVAPLLGRLGARATFYVCPGWWGGQHPQLPGPAGRLLGEDHARQLHATGMELGSHTMTHPDLRTLDDDALEWELTASKAGIEEITGRPCRTFAYPFGLFDERVEQAVRAAGYELAFAWLPGPWRPLAAPRLPGPTRNGAGRLALKLLGISRRGA